MGAEWLLPVYGLIVGTLVGLTGMGGGVLMTPLLVLGLGMPATAAIGTDLAYSALTKLAGTWQHWRQGTVDVRVVRSLAIGSVPATLRWPSCSCSIPWTPRRSMLPWSGSSG